MADERGPGGHGRWTGWAQATAALVGAFVALAGLVIGFWRPAEEPKPVQPAQAPVASPSASPAAPGPIAVKAERASIDWAGPASEDGSRTLSAVVAVRITNQGDLPVDIAWLDARRSAVLDLDDGTHLAGGKASIFSGFPDCERRRPDDCSRRNATRLVPGESQLATLTLAAEAGKDTQPRIAGARKAGLVARLAILPGGDEDAAYAKSVSLDFALANAAR